LSQEQQLAQALQGQMQGQGPNLGQTQLQSALNQENQQAAGLIAGQRGLNPQLAARQILQNNAQNNQASANQSAQLQQQQQLAAQQQLAGVLGQEGNLGISQIGALGGIQQGQNALNVQQNLGVQGINAGVASQNAQAANSFVPSLLGGIGGLGQGAASAAKAFSGGGEVPAMVSPGEKIIPPGGSADDGGIVPGEAPVQGDSPQNDIVPKMLRPGTIVVPRSVTQRLDPDAVKNFMAAVRGEPAEGYGKVVAARRKWKGGKL
jgi:hypothetical protein